MDPLEQLAETLIVAAQERREGDPYKSDEELWPGRPISNWRGILNKIRHAPKKTHGLRWPLTAPPLWSPLMLGLRQAKDAPLGEDWSRATDAERRRRLRDFLYNHPLLAGALAERVFRAYGEA